MVRLAFFILVAGSVWAQPIPVNLQVNVSPATAGNSLFATVSVSPSQGAMTPDGSVEMTLDSGQTQTLPLYAQGLLGLASFEFRPVYLNTRGATIRYLGNSRFAAASITTFITVRPISTSFGISVTPSTIAVGMYVTAFIGLGTGGFGPGLRGQLRVALDSQEILNQTLEGGFQISQELPGLTVGTHTLSGSYNADASAGLINGPLFASATITVTPAATTSAAPTTTSLRADRFAATVADLVVLTGGVTRSTGGFARGTVALRTNGVTLARLSLDGSGRFTYRTLLPEGANALTAEYSQTDQDAGSKSSTVFVDVVPLPGKNRIALQLSNQTPVWENGTIQTLLAETLVSQPNGDPATGGTVTLLLNDKALSTQTVRNGLSEVTISALPGLENTVQARYQAADGSSVLSPAYSVQAGTGPAPTRSFGRSLQIVPRTPFVGQPVDLRMAEQDAHNVAPGPVLFTLMRSDSPDPLFASAWVYAGGAYHAMSPGLTEGVWSVTATSFGSGAWRTERQLDSLSVRPISGLHLTLSAIVSLNSSSIALKATLPQFQGVTVNWGQVYFVAAGKRIGAAAPDASGVAQTTVPFAGGLGSTVSAVWEPVDGVKGGSSDETGFGLAAMPLACSLTLSASVAGYGSSVSYTFAIDPSPIAGGIRIVTDTGLLMVEAGWPAARSGKLSFLQAGVTKLTAIYPGGFFYQECRASATVEVRGGPAAPNGLPGTGEVLALDSLSFLWGGFGGETAVDPSMPITLGGATIRLTDSYGNLRQARLYSVTPTVASFLVPADLRPGLVDVALENANGRFAGKGSIFRVWPVVVSADGSGSGPAAGRAVWADDDGNLQSQALPEAIPSSRTVVLELVGTGWRGATTVRATIGGIEAAVLYASLHPTILGLDQLNLQIPAGLPLDADLPLRIVADGRSARDLTIRLR